MIEYQTRLDRAFHALSDATRRGMVERLARGPASVSELAKPFPTTLAAVHQHVQVLEASGLITTQKRGRTRECRLSADAMAQVEGWLTERRKLWEDRFDALQEIVETDARKDTDQ